MPRRQTPQLLLLILFLAALTSLWGLTSKGLQTWDEGVYYDEARFLLQASRAATWLALGRLFPHAGYPDLNAAKYSITALPPSMGRPVNDLLNSAGLLALGDHTWVPALIAALAGLCCLYLAYRIARRLFGDLAGLVTALLLGLSPYFLPYRRLGICEANGACLALLTIWVLLTTSADGPGKAARRHSWWLGMLCGLAFGANTRTVLLLPAVMLWRAWFTWSSARGSSLRVRPSESSRLEVQLTPRDPEGGLADRTSPSVNATPNVGTIPQWQDGWWMHGARVALGFALLLMLYQLPYLLIGPLSTRFGTGFESYFAQLHRFAVGQRELGGVGPVRAYGAPAYFFLYNEGPVVLLFLAGVCLLWRRRQREPLLVVSLFVLPLVQTGFLIPYARYQSWLLPLFSLVAASGLVELADWIAGVAARRSSLPLPERAGGSSASGEGPLSPAGEPPALLERGKIDAGWRAHVPIIVLLLLVGVHACYRGAPLLTARSQHPAALQWCKVHGAQYLVDTNLSAALGQAPLFRLRQMRAMPVAPPEAARAIRQFGDPARVMVVVETQQFMDSAIIFSVERYQQSAAAELQAEGKPLWHSHAHLRGLFPFLGFEHNRDLRETLRTLRTYREQASDLAIYDGASALRVLEENGSVSTPAKP